MNLSRGSPNRQYKSKWSDEERFKGVFIFTILTISKKYPKLFKLPEQTPGSIHKQEIPTAFNKDESKMSDEMHQLICRSCCG